MLTSISIIVALVVVLGTPILLILSRDYFRRRGSDSRHQRFCESLKDYGEGPYITVAVYPKRADLVKILRIEQRSVASPIFRILAILLFSLWVINGASELFQFFRTENPDARVMAVFSCGIGFVVGSIGLWALVFRPILVRRRIMHASDSQTQSVFKLTYAFGPEGIIITNQEITSQVPWDAVDRVVQNCEEVLVHFRERDFAWIPQDSVFIDGDWNQLQEILQPLKTRR